MDSRIDQRVKNYINKMIRWSVLNQPQAPVKSGGGSSSQRPQKKQAAQSSHSGTGSIGDGGRSNRQYNADAMDLGGAGAAPEGGSNDVAMEV